MSTHFGLRNARTITLHLHPHQNLNAEHYWIRGIEAHCLSVFLEARLASRDRGVGVRIWGWCVHANRMIMIVWACMSIDVWACVIWMPAMFPFPNYISVCSEWGRESLPRDNNRINNKNTIISWLYLKGKVHNISIIQFNKTEKKKLKNWNLSTAPSSSWMAPRNRMSNLVAVNRFITMIIIIIIIRFSWSLFSFARLIARLLPL